MGDVPECPECHLKKNVRLNWIRTNADEYYCSKCDIRFEYWWIEGHYIDPETGDLIAKGDQNGEFLEANE
jgi:hypothetical protein